MRLLRKGLGVLIVGTILVGCGSTQEHRARQYSKVFGELPEEMQHRVLAGGLKKGDSREAVYIALGPPQVQSSISYIEIWEYNARPIPSETPFTDGSVERFLTPNSGAWSPTWDGKSGHLTVEFENGLVSLWDYQEGGFPLDVHPHQNIKLPEPR